MFLLDIRYKIYAGTGIRGVVADTKRYRPVRRELFDVNSQLNTYEVGK